MINTSERPRSVRGQLQPQPASPASPTTLAVAQPATTKRPATQRDRDQEQREQQEQSQRRLAPDTLPSMPSPAAAAAAQPGRLAIQPGPRLGQKSSIDEAILPNPSQITFPIRMPSQQSEPLESQRQLPKSGQLALQSGQQDQFGQSGQPDQLALQSGQPDQLGLSAPRQPNYESFRITTPSQLASQSGQPEQLGLSAPRKPDYASIQIPTPSQLAVQSEQQDRYGPSAPRPPDDAGFRDPRRSSALMDTKEYSTVSQSRQQETYPSAPQLKQRPLVVPSYEIQDRESFRPTDTSLIMQADGSYERPVYNPEASKTYRKQDDSATTQVHEVFKKGQMDLSESDKILVYSGNLDFIQKFTQFLKERKSKRKSFDPSLLRIFKTLNLYFTEKFPIIKQILEMVDKNNGYYEINENISNLFTKKVMYSVDLHNDITIAYAIIFIIYVIITNSDIFESVLDTLRKMDPIKPMEDETYKELTDRLVKIVQQLQSAIIYAVAEQQKVHLGEELKEQLRLSLATQFLLEQEANALQIQNIHSLVNTAVKNIDMHKSGIKSALDRQLLHGGSGNKTDNYYNYMKYKTRYMNLKNQ